MEFIYTTFICLYGVINTLHLIRHTSPTFKIQVIAQMRTLHTNTHTQKTTLWCSEGRGESRPSPSGAEDEAREVVGWVRE